MDAKSRFKLLVEIESELGQRADTLGILTLTEAERVYLRACWAKGALDCNGFAYFFLGPIQSDEAADALERIGFPAAAEACRQAAAEFPEGQPMPDLAERKRWIEAKGADLIEKWDRCCQPVWAISSERFDEALASYLIENRASFTLEADTQALT